MMMMMLRNDDGVKWDVLDDDYDDRYDHPGLSLVSESGLKPAKVARQLSSTTWITMI